MRVPARTMQSIGIASALNQSRFSLDDWVGRLAIESWTWGQDPDSCLC